MDTALYCPLCIDENGYALQDLLHSPLTPTSLGPYDYYMMGKHSTQGATGRIHRQKRPETLENNRKRTQVACERCRKRKIKCVGAGIRSGKSCESCSLAGEECVVQRVNTSGKQWNLEFDSDNQFSSSRDRSLSFPAPEEVEDHQISGNFHGVPRTSTRGSVAGGERSLHEAAYEESTGYPTHGLHRPPHPNTQDRNTLPGFSTVANMYPSIGNASAHIPLDTQADGLSSYFAYDTSHYSAGDRQRRQVPTMMDSRHPGGVRQTLTDSNSPNYHQRDGHGSLSSTGPETVTNAEGITELLSNKEEHRIQGLPNINRPAFASTQYRPPDATSTRSSLQAQRPPLGALDIPSTYNGFPTSNFRQHPTLPYPSTATTPLHHPAHTIDQAQYNRRASYAYPTYASHDPTRSNRTNHMSNMQTGGVNGGTSTAGEGGHGYNTHTPPYASYPAHPLYHANPGMAEPAQAPSFGQISNGMDYLPYNYKGPGHAYPPQGYQRQPQPHGHAQAHGNGHNHRRRHGHGAGRTSYSHAKEDGEVADDVEMETAAG